MSLHTFITRLVRSSYTKNIYKKWSVKERADTLLALWQGLNSGLDYAERYELIVEAYRDRRLYKLPMLTSEAQARLYGIFRMVEESRQVLGDIVEAGVGLGHSLAGFVSAVSFFKIDKAVYGFDSFQGFPEAAPEDRGPRVKDLGAVGGWTETSMDMIAEVFRQDKAWPWSLLLRHDVEVNLIPGFFETSMPHRLPEHIALLHVDCDLYESYKTVLESCLPRVSPGGLIIFDEYGQPRWPGAKRAADEICEQHHLTIEYFDFAGRFGVRMPL